MSRQEQYQIRIKRRPRPDHKLVWQYERKGYHHIVFHNRTVYEITDYMIKEIKGAEGLETEVLKYDSLADDFLVHGIFKKVVRAK